MYYICMQFWQFWFQKITCYTFICYNWYGVHFFGKLQVYIDTLELKFCKKSLKLRSHKSFENALKTGLFADVKNFAVLVWSQFLHYRKNILHGSFFCIYKPHFGWGPKFYQIFFRTGQASAHLSMKEIHCISLYVNYFLKNLKK